LLGVGPGITVQPSEESGDGMVEGDSVAPVQVNAYSDAEQTSWQALATGFPSGPRTVPSDATWPPLGTSQALKLAWAQQPIALASVLTISTSSRLRGGQRARTHSWCTRYAAQIEQFKGEAGFEQIAKPRSIARPRKIRDS
jgi:hypothetical protein